MQGSSVTHLSARVPWHDRRWDGHVCSEPSNNNSCLVLKAISENRKDDAEDRVHDQDINDLERELKPPCLKERVTFLSGRPCDLSIIMDYSRWSADHKHILPTPLRIPAWGAALLPYRWLLRENAFDIAAELDLDVSKEREPADPAFLKYTAWVQNQDNQRALLDGFAQRCLPEQSLVFFYAKRTPLADDDRRVIVAVGLLAHCGNVREYDYEGGMPGNRLRSMIWERPIQHSLRPDRDNPGHFIGGIVLPYHAILERAEQDDGLDPAEFLACAPNEIRQQFSYASEHVSHGAAITALMACKTALERASKHLTGPWPQQIAWIDQQVNRLWKLQGPCPGLGSALSAIEDGFNGTLFALALSDQLKETDDPWQLTDQIFRGQRPAPAGAPRFTRMLRRRWAFLHDEEPKRAALLRLLSRFELTRDQAVRWFDNEPMTDAALGNPYLLFEKDRFTSDPIGLWTIDRGIFPDDVILKRFPLPAECDIDPDEPDDPRRLRAAGVQILEEAASGSGHALLDAGRAHAAAQAMPATRPVALDAMAIKLCKQDFKEEIAVMDIPGIGGPAAQLERYRCYGELIRKGITERLKNPPASSEIDWRSGVDKAFGKAAEGDAEEAKARDEKARALSIVAGSRIAVVIGPAGTGKTTVLRQLLQQARLVGSGVILLAPTGKARVRLGQQTKFPEKARTLAQFLLEYGRYDTWTSRYYADSKKPQADGVTTCIVDEASMLTEDQFAALIDALPVSTRLILVGDPRQLPPIGAGRPFVDLIAFLEREHGSKGVAELTVRRRHASAQRSSGATRDLACADVQLADLFSGRDLPPGEDQILESVLTGAADDRLRAVSWNSPTQLRETLDRVLAEELALASGDEENDLSVSLGGNATNGYVYFSPGPQIVKSDDWQVLTPHRTQPTGSIDLNRHIKARFRQKTLDFARKSNEGPSYYDKYRMIAPRGPEQITYGDKVICIRNHGREGWRFATREKDEDGYVANGEIGMVVGEAYKAKEKPSWTKVQFASQVGHVYSFGGRDFSEEGSPILELAYAVTVHKAQGSEFRKVFLVLPARSRLLSREMLYTALTRQTDRVVVLQQGGFDHLRAYRSAFFSEVARRLTNLFTAPTMIEVAPPAGVVPGQVGRTFLEDKLIHRSARGDLVSSKSEVVIADALYDAEKEFGIRYFFERALIAPDGSTRWPDFSIEDRSGQTWYWEHCGMLDQPDYIARWKCKLDWYTKHEIGRWSDARPAGRLIVTDDGPAKGLDSSGIRDLIRRLWGQQS